MLRDFPLACSFQFFTLDSSATESGSERISSLSILYIGFGEIEDNSREAKATSFQFFTLDSPERYIVFNDMVSNNFQFFTLDSLSAFRSVVAREDHYLLSILYIGFNNRLAIEKKRGCTRLSILYIGFLLKQ